MRQVGNSHVMMAGGLFLIAFFVCMVILWKTGIIESGSAEISSASATRYPTLRIGQGGVEPATTGERSERSKFTGTWTGKFIDAQGNSGDAELIINEDSGRSLSGRWNGASIQNAKPAEDGVSWETTQHGRLWRFHGHIHDHSLMLVTLQALASDSEETKARSGTAFLTRDDETPSSSPDTAAYSGIWTGLYAEGRDSGVTMISLHENKAGLSGAWNGKAPITQARISDDLVEWECDQGRTHFHNIGRIYGDGKKLALIFSATEGSDKNGHCGSALYSKNP